MTKVNTICTVATIFMVISGITVKGQLDYMGNLKLNYSQSHSHSYFDEIAYINKLAQFTRSLESVRIHEKLDELSEHLLDLSSTFRKQVSGKFAANVTDTNDGADISNFQELLLSASERMAAGTSSSACVNDTKLLITSIYKRQPWALKFLDAFGKPGPGLTLYRLNFIGEYSQCRGISALSADGIRRFQGNYCTLKASLGPPMPFDFLTIQLGACLPDTCSAKENTRFVGGVISLLGINGTLQTQPAECHTPDAHMTTVTIISIVVLVIISTLIVIGTGFDIIFIQWPKWKDANQSAGSSFRFSDPAAQAYSHIITEEENQAPVSELTGLLANARSHKQENYSMGICSKVLLSFSVYTNGSKVLDTSQSEGSLSSIHGIRFLSMSWVLLGHMLVFGIRQFGNALSIMPVWLKDWSFDAISNAFVSVDTFFAISGLLTAYLTLNEIKKRGWKINWPLFYFHRFWRLTPPYMLTLLVVTGLQKYLGSGPQWPSGADDENCVNNWWTNLLYINNLVNTDKMCFGHSWYLANDMQFYILSPLMIVPFYFNRFIGMAVCLGFLTISWITTGVLSTQNQWPSTLVSASQHPGYATFQEYYYIKPWCRIGPYIIGLMAGAYLSLRQDKRLPVSATCLGWVTAIATGLAVVYGLHGDISGQNVSSVGVAAFYNTVARSAWGACVAWVIIACSSGCGGFVNRILSWSPFVTLGRLTYMAYLIHPCLLLVYYQNQETLYYLSNINLTVTFCGMVVITNMAAFVLMLAFESPWIGLEKTFIHKKPKS
ncbi:hypothetical protein BsWGS_23663 [Bradybaena similaris]